MPNKKYHIISTVLDSVMFSINNTRLFADRSNNNLQFFLCKTRELLSENLFRETHVYECHTNTQNLILLFLLSLPALRFYDLI